MRDCRTSGAESSAAGIASCFAMSETVHVSVAVVHGSDHAYVLADGAAAIGRFLHLLTLSSPPSADEVECDADDKETEERDQCSGGGHEDDIDCGAMVMMYNDGGIVGRVRQVAHRWLLCRLLV